MHSIEFCAGAGGQALGLEQAGFCHEALVEIEPDFAKTLKLNRSHWDVRAADMAEFDGKPFEGVELLTAGLPCPPFSVAGKQLGEKDERNLFPSAIRLIDEIKPKAVMIENVRGFLSAVFEDYRGQLKQQLSKLGYHVDWRLLNSSDFGVPQLRPRVVIVALRKNLVGSFDWPDVQPHNPQTVGECLRDLMASNGWRGVDQWVERANEIAPTLVGGSKKHGGPDLGPTRARRAWATLGVEGKSLANDAPERDFVGMPRLTLRMTARLQGFPDDWEFHGTKTTKYRQIGNAFPPPVARAVAENLRSAIGYQRAFPTNAVA
ncbi:DNA cytosine methyltransferase [Erythrobacter sp. W53]|uniref:DNA cytosine methyltransferase n=1 Tax=Erythrobacter sp. W53 TaxID=3425947 RepID=UPI003D766B0E